MKSTKKPKATAKRGRPNKATSENRKSDILNVALKLFSEHGFDNTSMPMIAREIGVSQPAILHYFPKKEDLFSEVFQLVLESNRRVTDSLHSAHDDATKRLYKYILGNITWMTHHKDQASLLLLLYYYAQLRPYFSSLYSRLLEGAITKFSDILLAGHRENIFNFDTHETRKISTLFHNYTLGACVNRSATTQSNIYPHENILTELDILCQKILKIKKRPKSFENIKNVNLDTLKKI